MKKILFPLLTVLFLALVFNCSAVPDKNPSIQRQWMLISFEDFSRDQLIAHQAEINLTGKMEKGKIQGNAYMGCNQMSFTSEFKKDGTVKIFPGVSTMKACQDMNLETSFQKKIETMTKYSVEGHFLIFSDKLGNTMKFVAADWD